MSFTVMDHALLLSVARNEEEEEEEGGKGGGEGGVSFKPYLPSLHPLLY